MKPVYLAFTAPDEGEFCLTEILGNKIITLLSCPISLAIGFLKFIRRLDSVPESTINTNQGINEGLNLIHLARSINSLIGGKI